jgi:O-antigen/teichoic acid export membrane protein
MNVTRPILHVTSLTLIVNVALNVALIPLYGIEGAALSLTIANAMRFLVLIWISYRRTGILPFSGSMAKMIISGGTSLAAVNVFARLLFSEFPIHVMVIVFIVFVFLYLALMLVMRGFGREDIEILREVERKMGIRIGFLRRIINRFI